MRDADDIKSLKHSNSVAGSSPHVDERLPAQPPPSTDLRQSDLPSDFQIPRIPDVYDSSDRRYFEVESALRALIHLVVMVLFTALSAINWTVGLVVSALGCLVVYTHVGPLFSYPGKMDWLSRVSFWWCLSCYILIILAAMVPPLGLLLSWHL